MGPVKSTSTSIANDPKAANVAVCGSPITLSAKAKTAGMTIAARVACLSAARPGSVRRSCGIASRRLRLISPSSGEADPAALGWELVEDLLGGQAAILAPEQLDDGAAGAAVSMPLRLQRGDRRGGPRIGLRGHGANGSASRMQIVERMSIVSVWLE